MATVNNKNIDNADGHTVRVDIENTFAAVASNNYGPSNEVGELLPCEFYADAQTKKLYIRGTDGNENLFEIGDLDTKHLGLIKAGSPPDSVSGQIFGANQTAEAPSFSFDGDTDTGMYRAGRNNLGFAAAGLVRVKINADGLTIFSNESGNNRVKSLFLLDEDNSQSVSLRSPDSLSETYELIFPTSLGAGGFLQVDEHGNITIGDPGGGSDTPSDSTLQNYVNKAGGEANAMDGPFRAADGTDDAPGLSFNEDSDTGFFRETDDRVGLSLGGDNRYSFSRTDFRIGTNIELIQPVGAAGDSYIQINTDGSLRTPDRPMPPHAILDLSVDDDTRAPLDDYGLRLIREPRCEQEIGGVAPSAGSSTLRHRGIAPTPINGKTFAGNLALDCQGQNTGNIAFYTGGDPDPNATDDGEIPSPLRAVISPLGALSLGAGTNSSPIEASGVVDSGIIACVPHLTTPYRSHGFAVNAVMIPGIFNRTGSNGEIVQFKKDGDPLGSIKTNNGTSIFLDDNSDYRLKQDVREVDDAITKIKSLRPVDFRWKKNVDFGYQTGFIAHEVQETGYFHYAVSGEKDGTQKNYADPTLDEPAYQGVDYSKFTPMLVAALQEALVKIESLEARVTALEDAQ